MKRIQRITSHILVLLLLAGCGPAKKGTRMHTNAFDYQGHRGSRGLLPENTVPSMLKALDLGVTTLEMDAVITGDSQVVLSHEPFFNHEITLKRDGSPVSVAEERGLNIYRMTYSEVQGFDVGSKEHPRFAQQQKMKATKPLLRTVIRESEAHSRGVKRPLPFYNIETKSKPEWDNVYHPVPERFVDLLLQVVRSEGVVDRTIIQSFDDRTLRYLHRTDPSVKTALLIEKEDKRSPEELLQALGYIPTIYSPEYTTVTKELIRFCHEKGMRIIPWTVNTREEMERLKKWGVDGIISDYPNLFR